MRIEHTFATTLPAPTGSFLVGRTSVPSEHRVIWIWYPSTGGPPADYLPPPVRQQVERSRVTLVNKFFTRDLSKVRAHCAKDPDVSPQQRSYPVVLMTAGLGFSTLAEDLASHGYVVAGFDIERAPQNNPENFSGEEKQRVAQGLQDAAITEMQIVLMQLAELNASGKFAGRLDLTRVGAIGHSLGGATVAQFCAGDLRCGAGIDIDGALRRRVVETGIQRPFMFLMSDHRNDNDPESLRIKADIQSVYDRLPRDGRLRVAIRGAKHFGFSDDAVLKSRILLALFGIHGRRQLEVTAYCAHSFFDAYLKGEALQIRSPRYPEIEVLE